MSFTVAGRTVQRAAIVGSGNLGPDLALFFSRALARHGVPVVVHDVSRRALEAGRERIVKKLGRATESGVFRLAEASSILENISFTADRSLLVGCCFVVEAAPERLELKQALFEELERVVPAHGILASASGHLEPERIFERLRRKDRALIHHFFFPAERNPLVEIVAGADPRTAEWCARFYEAVGKVPVRARGRYGYAVNPVFEGLFLAALLLEEKGFPPAVIDAAACRALGLTAGPFSVMNLSGGSPVAHEAYPRYARDLMPWFRSPASLEEHVSAGAKWRTADHGETVSYSNAMFDEISRALLGAYFGLTLEVLESGVAELADLNLGIELGLAIKSPFTLMNQLGPKKVRELVQTYAAQHPGFRIPRSFGPWEIPVVLREDRDGVAVLRLRRPRALNEVDRDVVRQLDRHLAALQEDASVRAVVLTGFGVKAFSAGTDVDLLYSLPSPEEAARFSQELQRVCRRLETLGKPTVCALNGISMGAGSELAYACTARIAKTGLPVAFGQPEVRLGILPAGGATQRLPRLIEFPVAWRLLRTGATLSGEEAHAQGLVLELVEGDLIERAETIAKSLPLPGPLPPPKVPAELPGLDLGGLSRRVDEILRKAVVEGARLPLEQGLELETRCFAEAFGTRDRQIGLENYQRSGLKQPAVFVHA
jgi:enoyl-CoA hydratase/3-hydroxyacyl-CoA dehydrogenase